MTYKVEGVRYTLRRTLGQYEHEELEVRLTCELDEKPDANAMLKEAREICIKNSTAFLRKQANKETE